MNYLWLKMVMEDIACRLSGSLRVLHCYLLIKPVISCFCLESHLKLHLDLELDYISPGSQSIISLGIRMHLDLFMPIAACHVCLEGMNVLLIYRLHS